MRIVGSLGLRENSHSSYEIILYLRRTIGMLFKFVFIVLAVALGIVLGMGTLFMLIMNEKVMNWYIKKTQEMMTKSLEKMGF